MTHGWFVTGTDTGIGKTHASVALLHALKRHGLRVAGMKPVASGCEATPDGPRNEDALALQAASDGAVDYRLVNPYALRTPTAPEIAAAIDDVIVEPAAIYDAYRALSADHHVVVEGVGGWLAPLSTTLLQHDLVVALQLPVVFVVGLRLGCINHALLTEAKLRSDGVTIAGWIANGIDPAMDYADATLTILRTRLRSAHLGFLPYGVVPHEAAAGLDVRPLL